MRLDFIKGYFDVREYNAKKARAERTIKGNEAMITFDVTFAADQLPAELAKFAREYEKDGVTRYAVKFKISPKVKWFGYEGNNVVKIARPDNADLADKRFEVCLDFRQLDGDPTKMEACGYWVNGIVIREDDDMFADLNGGEPIQEASAQVKNDVDDDDLPW